MPLAAFDLDRTLIKVNSSFLFCFFLFKKKVISKNELTLIFKNYLLFKFFNLSLSQLHEKVFHTVFFKKNVYELSAFIPEFLDLLFEKHIYQPAYQRYKEFQSKDVTLLLLSSSPDFLVNAIAHRLNFEESHGTKYQVAANGKLIAIQSILDGFKKKELFLEISKKHTFSRDESFAYSDSDLDLPLLESAGKPVAVSPNRKLRRIALKRNWEII